VVPPALSEGPFAEALEIARKSSFTDAEWLEYERSKMAEQDERGRITFAQRQGEHRGKIEGAAHALLTVLRGRGIAVPDEARARILAERASARLEGWLERAGTAATVTELLDEPS
jgi:hypothetical protein